MEYLSDGSATKPLHAGWAAQAGVQAAALAEADDVESITVEVPAPGVPLVLEPLAAKHHPATVYDAKFSAPWTIAHHLVHGELTLTSFSAERIADPRLPARRVTRSPTPRSSTSSAPTPRWPFRGRRLMRWPPPSPPTTERPPSTRSSRRSGAPGRSRPEPDASAP
jgi:2-methylcitrate dehydratase PrpD